jgi:ORMDL family
MGRFLFIGASASGTASSSGKTNAISANSSRNGISETNGIGGRSHDGTSTSCKSSFFRRWIHRHSVNEGMHEPTININNGAPPTPSSSMSTPHWRIPRTFNRDRVTQETTKSPPQQVPKSRNVTFNNPELDPFPVTSISFIADDGKKEEKKRKPPDVVKMKLPTPVPLYPATITSTCSTFRTPDLRPRFNSRDISTTYAGQYGSVDTDLLPFECMRVHTINANVFLGGYLIVVLGCQAASIILILIYYSMPSLDIALTRYALTTLQDQIVLRFLFNFWTRVIIDSWTITNALHLFITISFIHWAKGRNTFLLLSSGMDEQGEMNALTVWEQLEAVPDSVAIRHILLIVPTVITYIACLSSNFQNESCLVNIMCWLVSMFAKLPCMNGVRLFGINRTAGIDDDHYLVFDDLTKIKCL